MNTFIETNLKAEFDVMNELQQRCNSDLKLLPGLIEKAEPKTINASRAQRIGRGSGTSAKTVRELIKQYNASKKMVKQIRKRRVGIGRGRGGVQVPGVKGRRIRR